MNCIIDVWLLLDMIRLYSDCTVTTSLFSLDHWPTARYTLRTRINISASQASPGLQPLMETVSKVLQLTSGKEAYEIAVFVGTIDSILMLLMSIILHMEFILVKYFRWHTRPVNICA